MKVTISDTRRTLSILRRKQQELSTLLGAKVSLSETVSLAIRCAAVKRMAKKRKKQGTTRGRPVGTTKRKMLHRAKRALLPHEVAAQVARERAETISNG